MKLRYTYFILLTGILAFLFSLPCVHAQEKYKLKPGASGELCLKCHDGFGEIMKKQYIHTPLAEGDCIGCHNPHTSSFELLMAASPNNICYTCHDSMVPEDNKSVHQVVLEGECIACHDPHASDNEFNLLKKGAELCFECHAELGKKISESKFSHPPVREDCLSCHTSHASDKNLNLLKAGTTALCLQCHETDKSTFKKLHNDYPVEKALCTSCHDPHGSNTGAMLYDNVHEPVAKRNCSQCHVAPTSEDPFQLKADGYLTCQACHYELITDTLNQSKIHWPLLDNKGCINCHAPHASPQEALLQKPTLILCAECHIDTVARQERSVTTHPPIAEGECSVCHAAHGSDNLFILNDDSILDLCAECHEWQSHSTHPIGEEYIDPRNKNITLTCASCHRTHGTENKHFLYFSTTNEQCVQCHVRFRR